MANILVMDNDLGILSQIEQALRSDDHQIFRAQTTKFALRHIRTRIPDLVILDAAQPEVSDLCHRLRDNTSTARLPILCVSAGLTPAEALNLGCDDFVRKPFAVIELAARVRALNRWVQRQSQQSPDSTSTLQLDSKQHTVYLGEKSVLLTATEYKLIELLAQQPGVYFTIGDLLQRVWKYPNGLNGAALVRNHICNLRGKIERDPERPAIVISQHGRGYSLSSEIRVTAR